MKARWNGRAKSEHAAWQFANRAYRGRSSLSQADDCKKVLEDYRSEPIDEKLRAIHVTNRRDGSSKRSEE